MTFGSGLLRQRSSKRHRPAQKLAAALAQVASEDDETTGDQSMEQKHEEDNLGKSTIRRRKKKLSKGLKSSAILSGLGEEDENEDEMISALPTKSNIKQKQSKSSKRSLDGWRKPGSALKYAQVPLETDNQTPSIHQKAPSRAVQGGSYSRDELEKLKAKQKTISSGSAKKNDETQNVPENNVVAGDDADRLQNGTEHSDTTTEEAEFIPVPGGRQHKTPFVGKKSDRRSKVTYDTSLSTDDDDFEQNQLRRTGITNVNFSTPTSMDDNVDESLLSINGLGQVISDLKSINLTAEKESRTSNTSIETIALKTEEHQKHIEEAKTNIQNLSNVYNDAQALLKVVREFCGFCEAKLPLIEALEEGRDTVETFLREEMAAERLLHLWDLSQRNQRATDVSFNFPLIYNQPFLSDASCQPELLEVAGAALPEIEQDEDGSASLDACTTRQQFRNKMWETSGLVHTLHTVCSGNLFGSRYLSAPTRIFERLVDIGNSDKIQTLRKEKFDKLHQAEDVIKSDVRPEYQDVNHLLNSFSVFRKSQTNYYESMYASISLVQLIEPIVRLECAFWDPFRSNTDAQFPHAWFQRIKQYIDSVEATELDRTDLLDAILSTILVDRIANLLRTCYNPFCISQTEKAIELVKYTLQLCSQKAEAQFRSLFADAVLAALRTALAELSVPVVSLNDDVALVTIHQLLFAAQLLTCTVHWSFLLSLDEQARQSTEELGIEQLAGDLCLPALDALKACTAALYTHVETFKNSQQALHILETYLRGTLRYFWLLRLVVSSLRTEWVLKAQNDKLSSASAVIEEILSGLYEATENLITLGSGLSSHSSLLHTTAEQCLVIWSHLRPAIVSEEHQTAEQRIQDMLFSLQGSRTESESHTTTTRTK